jgi:hypothetical protein
MQIAQHTVGVVIGVDRLSQRRGDIEAGRDVAVGQIFTDQ